MDDLLASIKNGSPIDVEKTADGFVIIPKEGQAATFTQMIEDLAFSPEDRFAVFPVSDGKTGYERAVILPLWFKGVAWAAKHNALMPVGTAHQPEQT